MGFHLDDYLVGLGVGIIISPLEHRVVVGFAAVILGFIVFVIKVIKVIKNVR